MKLLSFLIGSVAAINIKDISFSSLTSIETGLKNPLSAAERNAVGTALTNALGVLNGNQKPAGKLETCLKLFPNKKQEDESDALWTSCKEVLTPGSYLNMLAQKQKTQALPAVDEEGYKADWLTEHRSEKYPKASKGLQHHPAYNKTVPFIWKDWMTYTVAFLILLIICAIVFFYYRSKK